jgi:shikimate kinase/3-dehydroquinate synthase
VKRANHSSVGRPLFLAGPPCAGKSTVGRLVAGATGASFLDLEAEVERRVGVPVRETIGSWPGQHVALELRLLSQQLERGQPTVVALGSETLLERSRRLEALETAVLVGLNAPLETLFGRARASQHWLARVGQVDGSVAVALEARRQPYAEVHALLRTDRSSPEEVAARAVGVWQRDPIAVAAGERTYCVEVGVGVAPARSRLAVEGAPLVLVVTDGNVAPLHAAPLVRRLAEAGARVELMALQPGEEHKTPASLFSVWERALGIGADRSSILVALGGGVVTDVTGFAAATYMRGVRWLALPTTLLGMVDASVGGKTAVDLGPAKNAIGAFWQPMLVLCDPEFLRTEPQRGYVSALAEVLKTGLIGDPGLIELLERQAGAVLTREAGVLTEVVRRSVAVKASVVSRDERETGLRAVLNLGHTVGHALEAAGGYGGLSHGEAVSLGLMVALRVGQALGRTPSELVERLRELLATLGLPTEPGRDRLEAAVDLLTHDKKRRGSVVQFVVAEGAGRVATVPLELRQLEGLVRTLSR